MSIYIGDKKIVEDTVVDTAISDTSTNPVQNKTIKTYVDTEIADTKAYVDTQVGDIETILITINEGEG